MDRVKSPHRWIKSKQKKECNTMKNKKFNKSFIVGTDAYSDPFFQSLFSDIPYSTHYINNLYNSERNEMMNAFRYVQNGTVDL